MKSHYVLLSVQFILLTLILSLMQRMNSFSLLLALTFLSALIVYTCYEMAVKGPAAD